MNDYTKTIEARLKVLGVFVIVITLLLIWRMFDIQVVQHDHYLALAQEQQRFEKKELAARGRIYVHDSAVDQKSYYPLAFDVKKYAIWVVPRQVKDKNALAEKLASLLSLSKNDIFSTIDNDKLYVPPIKRNLSFDDADRVQSENLPGVFIMPEYSRFYPEGSLAAQVLGFVNGEGIGNYGFEGHYNSELTGKAGNIVGEKDTLGRVISMLDQQDPQDGTSYVLSIDRSVQYFVEKKLNEALTKYGAASGSVTVMDIKSGGIVAMASTPSYDPNAFRDQAKTDPSLFINPAIAHYFEPGSIFKPIIMAAAMDKGVVTPETKNVFGKTVEIQGYTIHTAEDKAFGEETMTQVLQNSDNVGMVWVGQQLGRDDMYKYIKNFGFLDKTGVDLDGEAAGKVASLKDWRDITQATLSFGQGIMVTPMEVLCAYAAIANKGRFIYPHLVDKIIAPDGSEKQIEKQEGEQIISQSTADQIKEMLYNVVMNGTAKKAKVPGFRVAVKTGTAQIADPNGGYLNNDSKLGIYNHSAAGLAPVDNPRLVMLVKLEKPTSSKYAESTAVPLFGEIANFLLNYHYRIAPTEAIN